MDLKFETDATFVQDDKSWLASRDGIDIARSITLDLSLFTEAIHYPDGFIPSGVTLAKVAATGRYGPYTVSDEVQTLTEGGSGLTSFTITFDGQTTASIDDDATAAQVQAALEALSNIDSGDVTVTGGPLGTGPFTVTFGGQYEGVNVPAMTTTPTGGTGTVVVATGIAGGTESATLGAMAGHLLSSVVVKPTNTDGRAAGALYWRGIVREARLPVNHGLNALGKADVASFIRYE